jgi:uncharacterized membrane protein SirB2
MYSNILALHSLLRWLVLVSLVFALFRAFRGWSSAASFTRADEMARITAASTAQIQLFIGVWLYYISPLTTLFLHHYKTTVHERPVRFFGMEHSTMMLTAIVFITFGAEIAKRKATDKQKFKSIAIWFSLALLTILINIPWPFSPMAVRPLFRPFLFS